MVTDIHTAHDIINNLVPRDIPRIRRVGADPEEVDALTYVGDLVGHEAGVCLVRAEAHLLGRRVYDSSR